MSNVNLKRFVDIDIQPHIPQNEITTRDTVALYTYEGTASTTKTFSSMNDVINDGTFISSSDTYKYLEMYFNNGGIKAQVYEGISYSDLTTDIIKSLPNEQIYVACVCNDANVEDCYSALKTLTNSLNEDETVYGINEKIILARTKASSGSTSALTVDTDLVRHFAVKFSSVLGAEMTIAAYLSQLDVDGVDTVKDYAFTEENIAEENVSDALFGVIIDNNMNTDILLSNAIRNCGGNCKDGSDLINEFTRIILHQTLTNQLVELLTQKIKSTTGISKMYSVIAQELERYKTCGYLTTDKIWTDKTLVISYNNVVYNIISKGDALLNGYVIKILPMSSLSDEDKSKHATPPIYVIIADQYGIRKITINGQVI